MQKSFLKIPFPGPLPFPRIIPRSANSLPGALAALTQFLTVPPSKCLPDDVLDPASTVLLTGAGVSVASGLADYRGKNGTYILNKTYRPIYHHEFLVSHEARKRYWARSFLGWPNLKNAIPNITHYAIKDLGAMGIVRNVITQNVDSFHSMAHPDLPTLELHGYLRALHCVSCNNEISRKEFQNELVKLNPTWAAFLEKALTSGALQNKDPAEKRAITFSTNPDGDVDVPDAPYSKFRYPACPRCLENPPIKNDGIKTKVEVDDDGAWKIGSTSGILKPAVVMFGESLASHVKNASENAIDSSGRLLILGTSLATYSAWRLAKRAKDRGMPIGIVNLGGVRSEVLFFQDLPTGQLGEAGVRVEFGTDEILPLLVDNLKRINFLPKTRKNSLKADREKSTNGLIPKNMISQ